MARPAARQAPARAEPHPLPARHPDKAQVHQRWEDRVRALEFQVDVLMGEVARLQQQVEASRS